MYVIPQQVLKTGAMALPARRFRGVLCALVLMVVNDPGSILAQSTKNSSSSTAQVNDLMSSTSSIFPTSDDAQTVSTRVTTIDESSPSTVEWNSSTSLGNASTPEMNTSSTTSGLAPTSVTTFLASTSTNMSGTATAEEPVYDTSSTTSQQGALSSSSSEIARSTGFSTSVGTLISASTQLHTTGTEQALKPEPPGTLSAGAVSVIIAFCVLGLIVLLGAAVYYIRSKRGPEFERLQDDVPMGHVQEGMPFAHLEK